MYLDSWWYSLEPSCISKTQNHSPEPPGSIGCRWESPKPASDLRSLWETPRVSRSKVISLVDTIFGIRRKNKKEYFLTIPCFADVSVCIAIGAFVHSRLHSRHLRRRGPGRHPGLACWLGRAGSSDASTKVGHLGGFVRGWLSRWWWSWDCWDVRKMFV